MKRDKLTEIKWNRETGTLAGDGETLKAMRAAPVVKKKGIAAIAVSSFGGDPENLIAHGVKRMPSVRTRSDGVKVGQVYLMGKQRKGEMVCANMEDGTRVEFILAKLPAELKPQSGVPRLPAPLRPLVGWTAQGIMPGGPVECFAFQCGISDLKLAREVQECVCDGFTSQVEALKGRVEWPEEVEPWKMPEGFQKFPAPHKRGDALAFIGGGLDGCKGWKKWRVLLGWDGPGDALAIDRLRSAVFNRQESYWLACDEMIDFPLPESGTPEFDTWEV